MEIIVEDSLVTTAAPCRGCIKEYRQNPADINCALRAAAHYAKREARPMAVTAGNSYMRFVWNICTIDRVNPVESNGGRSVTGFVVREDGRTYQIKECIW